MKKDEVLRNKSDFDRLRSLGKSVKSRYAIIVYLKNGRDFNRKAFLASKKIGNSVERHRAARLLRESFRLIEKEYAISNGIDFLLIARSSIKDLKCADVKKNIEAAMKNAGLLK